MRFTIVKRAKLYKASQCKIVNSITKVVSLEQYLRKHSKNQQTVHVDIGQIHFQWSTWLLESRNAEISQLILSRNQINVDINQCPDLTT